MHIRCGRATDVGIVRTENQDSLGMLPEDGGTLDDARGVLLVVADGMGGHRAGRRASELAVSTLLASYAPAHASGIPAALLAAVSEANRRVYEDGSSSPAYNGMGTTCTALVLQGTSAHIVHIGDSKAFLVTAGEITQITTDHSRVWELYTRGVITREQARMHPERNLLTKALGQTPKIAADLSGPLPLQPGSWFVLCTDGLTNHVEEREIADVVRRASPEGAADELVALARKRGGADNITVQIVAILEE
jgi:serine/threonine protein phosphatase PrpC